MTMIELANKNKLLKSLLHGTTRSCNNCGKVNCENFQRQRVDCCGQWKSFIDYISELEKENFRLNQIILGNEEEIADLKKNCEEYSKTFNRQNDEIVTLREKMIKAKEIIRSLYFIIQGRIDYKGNIPLEDEMYRAKQFLQEVSE